MKQEEYEKNEAERKRIRKECSKLKDDYKEEQKRHGIVINALTYSILDTQKKCKHTARRPTGNMTEQCEDCDMIFTMGVFL